MNAPRNVATPGIPALLAFLFPSLCTAVLRGQPPPLAPTGDVTIVVPNGPLHYSSILVPAGVTVRFVAPGGGSGSMPGWPAVVLCDGDAMVHGTLWLRGDSHSTNDRPAGWVTTGEGSGGTTCGSSVLTPPGGGRHAAPTERSCRSASKAAVWVGASDIWIRHATSSGPSALEEKAVGPIVGGDSARRCGSSAP